MIRAQRGAFTLELQTRRARHVVCARSHEALPVNPAAAPNFRCSRARLTLAPVVSRVISLPLRLTPPRAPAGSRRGARAAAQGADAPLATVVPLFPGRRAQVDVRAEGDVVVLASVAEDGSCQRLDLTPAAAVLLASRLAACAGRAGELGGHDGK